MAPNSKLGRITKGGMSKARRNCESRRPKGVSNRRVGWIDRKFPQPPAWHARRVPHKRINMCGIVGQPSRLPGGWVETDCQAWGESVTLCQSPNLARLLNSTEW
jgi:hypothetical protein